jgi:hypothetical protein
VSDERRRGRLEPVADTLGLALEAAGPAPQELTAIVRAWPSAAGELVAREAWPVRLRRDGVLLVHCRSSVWASELSLLAPRLLEALAREGITAPEALRFSVGPVPNRPPPPAPQQPLDPVSERLAGDLAEGVPAGPLRDAVAAAIRASLRLRSQRPKS